jgi:hypothetical protein
VRQRSGSVGFGFFAVCAMAVFAWGCQSVPEPRHKIVSQGNGYEIREYEGYVVAEVVMPGAWRDALYAGFRILFDYIEGNNEGRAKVAMTAPVLSGRPEKIAMTSPVLQEAVQVPPETDGRREGPPGQASPERHAIAFIAPAEFTVDRMPKKSGKKPGNCRQCSPGTAGSRSRSFAPPSTTRPGLLLRFVETKSSWRSCGRDCLQGIRIINYCADYGPQMEELKRSVG